jgi:predicted TIM-barrel fold metal-dependent hydrolase
VKRALISADNHVFEPVTLWQERLPVAFRDRGPRVAHRDGWVVMAIEGMPDRKLTRAGDGAGTPGEHEAGGRPGGADPAQRLRDMAHDGVVAEVVYPTFGLFIDMIPAPDLQMACARVYNDWLAESFLDRPDVFVPAAVVPVRDVASAAAELERAATLGFKAAMIPTSPPAGVPYNRPEYDALWTIASDAGMPLSLHTGTGALPQHERGPGGAIINYAKVGLLSAETLCYFCASGVLERFPRLRLVFVETGAGWLAYCCERMDEACEEHAQWVDPKLAAPPSHYAKTQCHVTLGADRAPLLTREITGVAPLLWASDYPHPEGTFPHSQEVVQRIFAGVPEDELRAIVGGNAARLYGITMPEPGHAPGPAAPRTVR